jgi:hypothetical protein
MRYVGLALLATAALMLAESASAASKKHPRYVQHARTPAVQYAPGWSSAPARMIEARPRAYAPYACIQDEGYGRWTYCGQGR